MLAQRVDGTRPVLRLRNDMERLFGGFFDTFPAWAPFRSFERCTLPAVDVWEDDRTLYAEVEVPGLKMADIEVLVMGDELTIKGERKDESVEEERFHRRERIADSFTRVFRLPVEVDADKVKAALHDGVLTITLPKAQATLPRKIEVKSG